MSARVREASEMGSFMRRVCNAMVRRSESGELAALVELHKTKAVLAKAYIDAGKAAHRHYTFTTIGEELGISRQRAQQLFGDD